MTVIRVKRWGEWPLIPGFLAKRDTSRRIAGIKGGFLACAVGTAMMGFAGGGALGQEDASDSTAAPRSFDSFEAKRVRPPKPGGGRLITIQIDPEEQRARLRAGAARASDVEVEGGDVAAGATPDAGSGDQGRVDQDAATGPVAKFGWFWEEMSPERDAGNPGRLDAALGLVAGHVDVPQPRLQMLNDIVQAHGIEILSKTIGTRVSPALVLAVISVESSGRVDAVSSAGAQGLMQLMPATAERFGVTDPFAPGENIAGGVRFLDHLVELFEGDPLLILAGYNAGAGSVRDNGGVPPYAETRDYVPKVLAAYAVARNLCKTVPVMITDGCVFQTLR